MSFKDKDIQKWTQQDLIAWIKSLPTDESFTSSVIEEIVAGIKAYAIEEKSAVTGEDFLDAEDAGDIQEMTRVKRKKAIALCKRFDAAKQAEYKKKEKEKGIQPGAPTNEGKSDDTLIFTLNVVGKQGQPIPLHKLNKRLTVAEVKAKYLEEQGNQTAADSYRTQKWDGEAGKISLKKGGKSMDNDRTLESYGIVNGLGLPLVVGFHVIGGMAEVKHDSGDGDDEDQYRKRKLRRKKHKQLIKRTTKVDCIMGYTDEDGIPRAEMPCGCAIASDTMWRYMKSLFEKDYKSTKLFCPTPQKLCAGNDEQREWKWPQIFAIADLSAKEIGKYTKIINNRLCGSKDCPHPGCGASTDKPDDVKIWRVRCIQCNNGDWCWACQGIWKASGLGPICGNDNCMGAQINAILANCDKVKPPWSDIANKGGEVPQVRACPKCCTTLEYTSACKHMWCLCCPHEFCFNCLGKWNDECSHSKECDLAKPQVFE